MIDKLPEGTWCDVNGGTVLTFNGCKMHAKWWEGDTKGSDFKVRIKNEGDSSYIVNDDPNAYSDFECMSQLTLRDDGTITAFEQILDGEGHRYLFVPEAKLEEERSIKDFSEDLPKNIESDELDRFSLSLGHYRVEKLDSGNYSFSLIKNYDGGYDYEFQGMADSYVIINHRTTVKEKYAKGLVKLLKDESILKHNGEFFSDRKENTEYLLYARFTSKEKISVKVGRKALDRWNIDEKKIINYALSIVPKEYLR